MPHILIVDDSDALRKVLRDYFTSLGYTCSEAASAKEAIAQVEKGVHPTAAVVDLILPEDSGLVVLDYLRGLSVPCVVFTALSTEICQDALPKDTPVLAKPAHPDVLVSALRSVSTSASKRRKSASLIEPSADTT